MPVVRRLRPRMASRSKPRRPQWKSRIGVLEEEPAEEAQHRIAEIAVERRHGAGRDAAREAVAHHELVAGAQRCDEGIEIGEVVAVVGVAHDDVAAARRVDAAGERRAVAARSGWGRRGRPRRSAIAWLPSVEPLSAMTTSPAMPVRSRKPRALRMQVASVSASLRQGIRMVSSRSAIGESRWVLERL